MICKIKRFSFFLISLYVKKINNADFIIKYIKVLLTKKGVYINKTAVVIMKKDCVWGNLRLYALNLLITKIFKDNIMKFANTYEITRPNNPYNFSKNEQRKIINTKYKNDE